MSNETKDGKSGLYKTIKKEAEVFYTREDILPISVDIILNDELKELSLIFKFIKTCRDRIRIEGDEARLRGIPKLQRSYLISAGLQSCCQRLS